MKNTSIHPLTASIAISLPTFNARPRDEGDDIPPDNEPQADWNSLEQAFQKAGLPTEDPDKDDKEDKDKEKEKKEGEEPEEEPEPEVDPEKAAITPKPEDEDPSKVSKEDKPEEEPEELKKFQPHPQASPEQVTQFKAIKTVLKTKIQEIKAKETELATARQELEAAKKAGGNPEEVQKLKEEVERLKKVSLVVDVEQSPEFKAQYDQPVAEAETALRATLKRLEMPDALIEQAVKQGDKWTRWEEAKKYLNDGQREELDDARRAMRKALRTKEDAVAKLRGPEREAFLQQRQEEQKNGEKSYWDATGQEASKLLQESGKYMLPQAIPEGATEDQKKAIEAANKVITERNSETSKLIAGAVRFRDPKATATLAFRAADSLFARAELTETKAALKKAQDRVTELEAIVNKARKLEKPRGSAPANVKNSGDDSLGEETAEEALERARREHANK